MRGKGLIQRMDSVGGVLATLGKLTDTQQVIFKQLNSRTLCPSYVLTDALNFMISLLPKVPPPHLSPPLPPNKDTHSLSLPSLSLSFSYGLCGEIMLSVRDLKQFASLHSTPPEHI